MKRRVSTIIFGVFVIGILTGCAVENKTAGEGIFQRNRQQYQVTYFDLFDTVTTIIGYAQTEEEFKTTSDAVYEELKKYHKWFDIYHEYDENNLMTINRQAGIAPVKVEKEIIQFLLECKEYYDLTGGAVNVAMGSVLKLWHETRTTAMENADLAELPTEEDLKEAMQHMGFETIIIDEEKSTVYISDPKQSLDVGAIAKGWAVERAAEELPEGYLISVGGNVRTTGPKPDGNSWNIGIQNPENSSEYMETVKTVRESVVTSGDYQRFVEIGGEKYHHLIDPATGYPADQWKSVTIICKDSGLADALSTALFVRSKEEGEAILEQCHGKAIWIEDNGKIVYSDNFEIKKE